MPARGEEGETIVTKRGAKTVAQPCPLPVGRKAEGVLGLEGGKTVMRDDFNDDLPEDFLITEMVYPAP